MLTALRAILLALFIAAPIGEPRPEEDTQRVVEEYAPDAVLSCPVTPRSPFNALRAGDGAAAAHPDGFAENA